MEERIKYFLSPGSGYGYGSGSGSGYDYGCGGGYGSGSGSGYDYGCGGGSGSGSCSGYGSGCGGGYGIKTYIGDDIHMIDEVPTIIRSVRHGVAKGFVLNEDLTTTPCYIVRSGDTYAHGSTLREAQEALTDKLLDSQSEEERIAAFWACHNRKDKYSGRDLWVWHHRLTGSCEMGRNQFCRDRGIDIDSSTWTVAEFVALCKGSYGGEIIRKLMEGNK